MFVETEYTLWLPFIFLPDASEIVPNGICLSLSLSFATGSPSRSRVECEKSFLKRKKFWVERRFFREATSKAPYGVFKIDGPGQFDAQSSKTGLLSKLQWVVQPYKQLQQPLYIVVTSI